MTSSTAPRYWGYRIDTDQIDFFWRELEQGRLRQGWGYDEGQDLRHRTVDEGASRNYRMFEEVSKGDILLVPRLPAWDKVSIVRATEDWNRGYRFEIPKDEGDYGHIFPTEFLKSFRRDSEHVTGNIRSTLKNQGRFWNIDHHREDIGKICDAKQEEFDHDILDKDRLTGAIEYAFHEVFKREEFGKIVYERLNTEFSDKQWEDVLAEVLQSRYPHSHVEKVSGRKEEDHGTDILIEAPGVSPDQGYAIAVQVKDYKGTVSEDVIEQIKKASYWDDPSGLKLIEKIVIFTKAKKVENRDLVDVRGQDDVKFIFAEDLKDILTDYAMDHIGLDVR